MQIHPLLSVFCRRIEFVLHFGASIFGSDFAIASSPPLPPSIAHFDGIILENRGFSCYFHPAVGGVGQVQFLPFSYTLISAGFVVNRAKMEGGGRKRNEEKERMEPSL